MVPLNRALSKLGVLSRTEATEAIRAGRVKVDGRIVRDPLASVVPERARIVVDGKAARRAVWRTILFHKPSGILTTVRDPQGRPTIYDILGDEARGLVPVGRLDLASSGLLLLTNDTQLAHWITNPENGVARVYVVTVRGRVTHDEAVKLTTGLEHDGHTLAAHTVRIRKVSARESHLTVELREGKNREVRRLFEAIGHEVTRLKRVRLGALELEGLKPGEWRPISRVELRKAFSKPESSRDA